MTSHHAMRFVVVLVTLAAVAAGGKKPLGPAPYVIGHRGSSAAYPEHTLLAYSKAIEEGADFIECDIVLTKDCVPVCRHEPNLIATTDAASKFPALKKTEVVDGYTDEGIFTTDLTLAQLRTLRAIQPRSFRDQSFNGLFQVPTLEEYIQLALNASRTVGIEPETKHPTWFQSKLGGTCLKGTNMSALVLQVFKKYGYTGPYGSPRWLRKPIFIQSFEINNLKWLASVSSIPLLQLLDEEGATTADTGTDYKDMATDDGLAAMSEYATGVGPWKQYIVPTNFTSNRILAATDFVQRAHAAGLQVHIYTLRNEAVQFLPFDYVADSYNEYAKFFVENEVDAAFSDSPGTLRNGLTRLLQLADNPPSDIRSADRLPTNRPWIIGHRGMCGKYPDHTLESYMAAIDAGADFIECDMTLTKDLQIICRHEPLLGGWVNGAWTTTTDALTKFPSLVKTYIVDGANMTGVFAHDLTLAQVRTLRAVQPLSFREQAFNGQFKIPTLNDYIDLAQNFTRNGRVIGIYPETKHPSFTNSLPIVTSKNLTFENLVLATLHRRGYNNAYCSTNWLSKPVYLQSFEVNNLKYMRTRTKIPMIQLMGGTVWDTQQSIQNFTSDASLNDIRSYAVGIGPSKSLLINSANNVMTGSTGLVARAKAKGLAVHPYTFRNEAQYLLWNWRVDPRQEYQYYLLQEGIDGAFTDFSGTMYDFIQATLQSPGKTPKFAKLTQPTTGGRLCWGNPAPARDDSSPPPASSPPFKVTFLHVNDIHARVQPQTTSFSTSNAGGLCGVNSSADVACFGGWARMAAAVAAERANVAVNGKDVVVLDAGDVSIGTLWDFVYKISQEPWYQTKIGFHAMTLGNHEFDNGPARLANYIRQVGKLSGANFSDNPSGSFATPLPSLQPDTGSSPVKILGANIQTTDPDLTPDLIAPYILIPLSNGVKIAVFGLTTDETPGISSPGPNVVFLDPISSARSTVKALTALGIKHIVALTHIGIDADVRLAQSVDGIDLIIGGHSHTFINNGSVVLNTVGSTVTRDFPFTVPGTSQTYTYPYVVNNTATGKPVPIVTAYAYSRYLGKLISNWDIDGNLLGWDSGSGPILLGGTNSSNPVTADPDIKARVDTQFQPLAALSAQPVGSSAVALVRDYYNESNIGNSISDAMVALAKQRLNAGLYPANIPVIGMQNSGGIRANLPAGTITYGSVVSVLPFGNTLAIVNVSGAAFKSGMEFVVGDSNGASPKFAQLSNMRIGYNPVAPSGSRISKIQVKNPLTGQYAPIDTNAYYPVATNNFMGISGGDGFTFLSQSKLLLNDPTTQDNLWAQYIAANSPLNPQIEGRIIRCDAVPSNSLCSVGK